ncbi:MAG: hypothetical protein HN521_09350 [Candidatus Latescibacteria bacterium]|nr:hypothetical protein [Candidatus Latescibacterota bacterium]
MPKQFDIEKMEHRSKVWLLVVSVTTLVVLIVAAVRENFLADWQILQNQYATVLKEKVCADLFHWHNDHWVFRQTFGHGGESTRSYALCQHWGLSEHASLQDVGGDLLRGTCVLAQIIPTAVGR